MEVIENFLFLAIIFEFVACFVGVILLLFIYSILKAVENRIFRIAIIAIVILVGLMLLIQIPASIFLFSIPAFGVPMAVLIPPFLVPGRENETISPWRIIFCYILVSIVALILPFILALSGFFTIPYIFLNTPFANAFVFACVMIIYTGLAAVIYHFTDQGKDQTEKKEAIN